MKRLNKVGITLKEQGRTQIWLSEKINRTPAAISAICLNKAQPRLNLLYEIADVLGVTPCDLLGDGSEIKRKKKEV